MGSLGHQDRCPAAGSAQCAPQQPGLSTSKSCRRNVCVTLHPPLHDSLARPRTWFTPARSARHMVQNWHRQPLASCRLHAHRAQHVGPTDLGCSVLRPRFPTCVPSPCPSVCRHGTGTPTTNSARVWSISSAGCQGCWPQTSRGLLRPFWPPPPPGSCWEQAVPTQH